MESTKTAPMADSSRQLLRHALATVAYRGGKTLRGAPEEAAADADEETADVATQVRSIIECVLDDSLQPAIRDLRAAAGAQRRQPSG